MKDNNVFVPCVFSIVPPPKVTDEESSEQSTLSSSIAFADTQLYLKILKKIKCLEERLDDNPRSSKRQCLQN